MTGEQLRAELERIADRAPSVEIDDDLFDRGRRATRRARVVTAAAVVGCLAVLAAVAVPLLRPDPPQVAGTDVLGVPDHLYAVPDHVADEPEDDLALGRGAAAFVTGGGVPVVVSAEDGAYHVLDLPGLLSAGSTDFPVILDQPPVALSPDGSRLAWGWLGTDSTELSGGVRVADLSDGSVVDVDLDDGEDVLVTQLSWSSDSGRLAWSGTRISRWDNDGVRTTSTLAGTITAAGDASVVQKLPMPENITADAIVSGDLAVEAVVSPSGEFAAVSGNALWRDGRTIRFPLAVGARLRGAWFRDDTVVVLRGDTSGDGRSYLVALPDGAPTMVLSDLDEPRRIGQLDADTQVLAHEALDEDGSPDPRVTLMTADRPGGSETSVVDVDRGVLGLTLATDLMSVDHPAVERAAPDWPWSTQRKVATVAVPGLLLLVLSCGAVLLRRRLRR